MSEPVDERAAELFARAAGCAREGRTEEALAAYREAIVIVPEFFEAQNNLGTLLASLGREAEAIAHFERAMALRPEIASTYCNLGVALYVLGRPERALEPLRAAIALEPENARALGLLGVVSAELGMLDEARTHFERAIACAPRDGSGWLYRRWTELATVRAQDAPLRAMQVLEGNVGALREEDRLQLHFALGKAYDDLARYADAFEHMRAGNELKRARIDYDQVEVLRAMQRTTEAFVPASLVAQEGRGDRSALPVFVIGMPRSGTTLVEQLLAAHPNVAGTGEIDEFERAVESVLGGAPDPERLAGASNREFAEIGRRYAERLRGYDADAERIVDKMLPNFRYAGAIHLALPQAKIVHVLRDPLDTCLSCYAQIFMEGLEFSYDLRELGHYYRAYERTMQHWRATLPPGVMLEVRYEELVADVEGQTRRMLAHCGLEWNGACLRFYRSQRPVRTASAAQVRRPVFAASVGRAARYGALLDPLREALGLAPSVSLPPS